MTNVNFIQIKGQTGNAKVVETTMTSIEADYITMPYKPSGWICPKCDIGVAPFVQYCPNCLHCKQVDHVPQYTYTYCGLLGEEAGE